MKLYNKQIILYTLLWVFIVMFFASFQDNFGVFSSFALRAPLFILSSYFIDLIVKE